MGTSYVIDTGQRTYAGGYATAVHTGVGRYDYPGGHFLSMQLSDALIVSGINIEMLSVSAEGIYTFSTYYDDDSATYEWDAADFPETVILECSYTCRLMCEVTLEDREVDHISSTYDETPTPKRWGPNYKWPGMGTYAWEICDPMPFWNARFYWCHFPSDGPVEAAMTIDGHRIEWTPAGTLNNVSEATGDIEVAAQWRSYTVKDTNRAHFSVFDLSVSAWGEIPDLETYSDTDVTSYPGGGNPIEFTTINRDDGVRCEVYNPYGSNITCVSLSAEFRPAQWLNVTGLAKTPNGKAFTAGYFNAEPYASPEIYEPVGAGHVITYPVADEWPAGDALSLPVPGSVSRKSRWYRSGCFYSWGGYSLGYGGFITLKEQTMAAPAVGFAFDPADLIALGYSGNNWRARLTSSLLPAYSALTATMAAGPLFDTFTAGVEDWTAVGGETLTAPFTDGSVVALKVEGSSPIEITKTFTATAGVREVWFDLFRHLRIAARFSEDVDPADVSLTIGAKVFAPLAPPATYENGTYYSIIFDLCSPSNLSGIDDTMTIYETEYVPTEGGWAWGVGPGDQTLVFSVATAQPVYIDSLRPVVQTNSTHTATVAPGFAADDPWEHDAHWYQPFLTHWIDGRVVAQQHCGVVVAGVGQYETDLDDSLTQLEMYQGLVGTDEKRGRGPATATTKGCIKITKPTSEGGTFTTINGVDVWTYTEFTKEVKPGYWLSDYRRGNATSANVITYYAQPSFDRVELGFGTSQSVALSMLKTFGGEVHGIVSDDATGPAVAVVVNADQASAEFDHDDTDAFGFFEMPAETTAIAEYRGDVETSVYPELEPTNVGVVTPGFGECWLHRFGLAAPGGSPARGKDTVLDNAAGMVTRVVGRADGNLYLDLFTISSNSWTTPEAISRGSNPSLAWYGATREAVVSMTYVVDGDLKQRTSADFGRNWEAEVDLGFAGTHPEMLFDPSSGVTYLFYITSSNVYVKRRDRPDGTYSAAVLVASTVTDDDLSAKLLSGTRAGTIQVHYTLGSGNIAVVTSADFGATWS